MMTRCIVCNSTHTKLLYAGILKCQECGHVFADLHLNDEELFEFYSENYFFGDEYSDYLADKRIFKRNFKLRLKVLQTFLDPIRHKRLLEIGCAYGFFLDVVKDQFDTVLGIDITEDGVLYARDQLKLNVINADLLKHGFGDQKFDVVCMWDTIEHLHSPHLYLEKMSRHIGSGSLIAITTGDIESMNARIRREKWRLIHPPTHLHYFSKKALGRMLNNNGFDIMYNRYCGFYRSIDNIAYNILILRKRWPRLYDFLCRSGLTRIDIYLNFYDIMYVIARKR